MKKLQVAIQGFAGSFHELTTRNYFLDEELELLCCDSFEEIFELIFKEKGCPCAVGGAQCAGRSNCCSG